MKLIRKLVSKILQEELGRNYHTVHNEPNTFEDFQDYNIEIIPAGNEKYMVLDNFKGNKVGDTAVFSSYEEARHHSRMVVDNHRVSAMNHGF